MEECFAHPVSLQLEVMDTGVNLVCSGGSGLCAKQMRGLTLAAAAAVW